ncbi:hypothetical protein DV704_08020 [Meiothermus sp. QL-1]|uniref:HsdM family class I SAM-dependent methyltransferase n=1 Tax=Meiothermus sp. QL-1 TaxID=2058095 RepID=UPI000E0C4F03|nr:N-6 DNA methylase [Meiothermus sp. QL-1]RDI95248.1 hypothetical protein DV704_08020 [Meiothermus sp. QL-1]
MILEGPPAPVAKALGAYYTDAGVARFLVRWALRAPRETVADPAFGGGVFLAAASERLAGMGGDPRAQVFGVELDEEAHRRTAAWLRARFDLPPAHLRQGDFFDLEPPGQVDAVVGNPPFIRYQRFPGLQKALAKAGLRLSGRSSAWAPFLLRAVAWLRPGGRLAMVVPAEIAHAAYARPVLDHLSRSFEEIWLISFQKSLFPRLNQDTLLLLAEGRRPMPDGRAAAWLVDLPDPAGLEQLALPTPKAVRVNLLALGGEARLPLYWLSPEERELYLRLAGPTALRLGQVARVDIGYVTGHNRFFHLSPAEAAQQGIPQAFLRAALWRGRGLRGLRFTSADWQEAGQKGQAGFLLSIPPEAPLPPAVAAYLEAGQAAQVHRAYQCRRRQPWYSLCPGGGPEAFLVYMGEPRLVVNEARVLLSNSLYAVHPQGLGARALAALWQSSLTQLSVELEGHALGGGMLKLEPREAERVVLPSTARNRWEEGRLEALADGLDRLLRQGKTQEAQALADSVILREGLGLSEEEVACLARARQKLRLRRCRRP